MTVAPISNGIDLREALSKHLHDLLNSLWPAAVQIELSISEETCPPKFRETLVELGRCVEEAMTIASQASVLVDSPTSERAPS
ncbi:MAG: hypothetical protein IAG10_20450 [Planctomycetaceae bacterium]|nr:hypothetical protein [Planctomycetaceae bacterium]